MNDLDTLRPEVREAINRQDRQEKCDEYCPVCEDRATIRAELLRLARENAILTAKNRGTLANNLCPDHRDKQTGKSCLACTIETLTRQKERAESERDALRKRIDDAPVGHPVSVDFSEMTLTVTIPNGFRTNGWPFALVPLDDAEAMG